MVQKRNTRGNSGGRSPSKCTELQLEAPWQDMDCWEGAASESAWQTAVRLRSGYNSRTLSILGAIRVVY